VRVGAPEGPTGRLNRKNLSCCPFMTAECAKKPSVIDVSKQSRGTYCYHFDSDDGRISPKRL
jgi:hypothetical protein